MRIDWWKRRATLARYKGSVEEQASVSDVWKRTEEKILDRQQLAKSSIIRVFTGVCLQTTINHC